MIKIDHLSKKYNNNVVLDDISLEIKQGDVVGIIGPSGTGKSTLLRCVNRLETPEKGTVTIGDKVIGLSERKPNSTQEWCSSGSICLRRKPHWKM